MDTKRCSKCKQYKPLSEFCKHRGKKDGLNLWCRQCYSESIKAKRALLPPKPKKPKQTAEELKRYKAEWHQKNKARTAKARAEWKKEHREERNLSQCEKYHSDINFRLLVNLRGRIYVAIKKGIGTKVETTKSLIGCTMDELKAHLESQFTPKMSWDNYGTYWHIDHIIPCRAFDLSDIEQQKKCFHWANMQPLAGKENLEKSDLLPNGTRARKLNPLNIGLGYGIAQA